MALLASDIEIEATDTAGTPPPQVYTSNVPGQQHVAGVVEVLNLRKKTPTGSAGSVTITNGRVTAYVKPT